MFYNKTQIFEKDIIQKDFLIFIMVCILYLYFMFKKMKQGCLVGYLGRLCNSRSQGPDSSPMLSTELT